MKKSHFLIPFLIFVAGTAFGQFNAGALKDKVQQGAKEISPVGSSLSNEEIIQGLKEALNVGTGNSVNLSSAVDGFYGNEKIKIPFPPEANKVMKMAIKLGMQSDVDKFVLTLNRAAEEATKDAVPVFSNAVTNMSISDGLAILKGEDNAATSYLKDATSNELIEKFKPVVQAAIDKVELTKYWNPLITAYNKVPMVEKQNPDLTAYVTERSVGGLFVLLAEEELKIRKDPLARVSDILKKVFG